MEKTEKDYRSINIYAFVVLPICAILLILFIKGSTNIFEIIFDALLLAGIVGILIYWMVVKKSYCINMYKKLMIHYDDVWQHYDQFMDSFYTLKSKEYYEQNYQLCKLRIAALTAKTKKEQKELMKQFKKHQIQQKQFDEL